MLFSKGKHAAEPKRRLWPPILAGIVTVAAVVGAAVPITNRLRQPKTPDRPPVSSAPSAATTTTATPPRSQ